MDDSKQNYELAFHISPNLEETKVREIRDALDQLLTSHGAVITFSKEPEKSRLSYPIRHERSSYFGYMQFSLIDTSKLTEIDEQLRLNNDILRYLLLKLETDAERAKAMSKMAAHKERQERRIKKVEAKKPEDTQKMEKQLEDIIGNL